MAKLATDVDARLPERYGEAFCSRLLSAVLAATRSLRSLFSSSFVAPAAIVVSPISSDVLGAEIRRDGRLYFYIFYFILLGFMPIFANY